MVVGLIQGTTHLERTIPRPASGQTSASVTLTGLRYGDYTVDVKACPGTDGSGVPQATGAGTMTVTEDVPGKLDVAMNSTVASLAIAAPATIHSDGETGTLTATAVDDQGRMVLLEAGGGKEAVTWTSANPGVASVAGTGPTATITGGALAGNAPVSVAVTASLRVTDGGATKAATVPVSVRPGRIVLAPSDAKGLLSRNGTTTLQATLECAAYPQSNVRSTWRAIFPLVGLPSGARIVSAVFSASALVSSQDAVVGAYPAATGTVQTGGAPGDVALGTFYPGPSRKSLDAKKGVEAALAAGMPFVGFNVGPRKPSGFGPWSSPDLTIVYELGP